MRKSTFVNSFIRVVPVFLRVQLSCVILLGSCAVLARAAEQNNCDIAGQKILSSKQGIGPTVKELELLKDCYYSQGKYGDFAAFLKNLGSKRKDMSAWADYLFALNRYDQLDYLEQNKKWEEYFASQEAYRKELTLYAEKAVKTVPASDALAVYSSLLLWQYHKQQQDAFAAEALTQLVSVTRGYSSSSTAELNVIKSAADGLSSLGEKGKAAEFYKIYVSRLASASADAEDLSSIARDFFKDGNIELAELAYDVYLDKSLKAQPPVDKSLPLLLEVAGVFAYKDGSVSDPQYAEKIYARIESLFGRESFSEAALYARAVNLEKSRFLKEAVGIYEELINRFPNGLTSEEAIFKVGVIKLYALGDMDSGRQYLQRLADSGKTGSYIVSSLYHLALLLQWEGDTSKAAEYYNLLIERAGKSHNEEVVLARARMAELAGSKPIEYNLRTFLELSFRPENAAFNMSKVDLKSSLAQARKGEEVSVSSSAQTAESGCMPLKLGFLWSGQIGGKGKLSATDAGFSTSYQDPGTKIINVVILHPSGIIDRSFTMIDIK